LTTVRHIAHVQAARRIIEDGQIKAGLVYDQSKLNKSRVSVAWVSANTWAFGSIYGTVEFQFAWPDLIGGRRVYWVESMNYQPKAYRLLLSNRDIPPGLIQPYNPVIDQGPLRFYDGKYYWNTAFTSEFMIEDDLSLDQCTGVRFVEHHPQYCGPFGNAFCEERAKQPPPEETGSKILAFVLGAGRHELDKHLKPPAHQSMELQRAYAGLESILPAEVQFGGATSANDDCQMVVCASLLHYGTGQTLQARNLLSLIASKDKFTTALKQIVRTHFDEPDWEPSEPAF